MCLGAKGGHMGVFRKEEVLIAYPSLLVTDSNILSCTSISPRLLSVDVSKAPTIERLLRAHC